ncbi:MAG: hypothetical protein VX346_12740 [Planctomycetota bacterium]|nr:hypothetical protein [Planctomycetota bacterium]
MLFPADLAGYPPPSLAQGHLRRQAKLAESDRFLDELDQSWAADQSIYRLRLQKDDAGLGGTHMAAPQSGTRCQQTRCQQISHQQPLQRRSFLHCLTLGSGAWSLSQTRPLAGYETAGAQHDIVREPRPGLQTVAIQISVNGHLRAGLSETQQELPLHVDGRLEYVEQLRPASTNRMIAIRHYARAAAEIEIAQQRTQSQLATDHRHIICGSGEHGDELFATQGPLTRDELDLIDVPGNSAQWWRLLPTQPVKLGDAWFLSRAAVKALLRLEAISKWAVRCKLQAVAGQMLTIAIAGTVEGAAGGAASQLRVDGTCQVDLTRKRIAELKLTIWEERQMGHAQPGFKIEAQIHAVAKPLAESAPAAEAVTKTPASNLNTLPDDLLLLSFRASQGGFQLLHDRRWRVLTDNPAVSILRCVQRGQLVAQANVSRLADRGDKPVWSPAQLEKKVRTSLGDKFTRIVDSVQRQDARGYRILRIRAAGAAEDVKLIWTYWYLANREGGQVSLVITHEQKHAAMLAETDQALADSVRISARAAAAPARQAAVRAIRPTVVK